MIFMDYEHVIKRCENACKFHSQMVSNLLQMIAMRASQQANRIYVLSRNSTRKKIMAYLNEVGGGKKKQVFTLPGILYDSGRISVRGPECNDAGI